jgi:hypothetical protein
LHFLPHYKALIYNLSAFFALANTYHLTPDTLCAAKRLIAVRASVAKFRWWLVKIIFVHFSLAFSPQIEQFAILSS